MALSDRQLLDALSRMPFIDSVELALILGEPHSTVHRFLTDMLADGIVGRVSHGTVHLPSSRRYYLTACGLREAAGGLDFGTPSDYVRAYLSGPTTLYSNLPPESSQFSLTRPTWEDSNPTTAHDPKSSYARDQKAPGNTT